MERFNYIIGFGDFVNQSALFEGGAAIKKSRRIREDEVPLTLEFIYNNLLPSIGVEKDDTVLIGSIGKKEDPSDTSGDIDLGISSEALSKSLGTQNNIKEISAALNQKVVSELPFGLTDSPDVNFLKGLNIVSLGWPIGGDFSNGIVQLDLIPISDMDWANFIYYSPDYRKKESKYKSAHRNWLFSAILDARKDPKSFDQSGEVIEYETPVLVLSDGLYKYTKSFKGKTKDRLSKASKIPGSETFITNDPEKFIEITMGKRYPVEKVKTFEDVFSIINSPDFDLYDNLDQIKEKYLEFIQRTGLEIPKEIKKS